jgi:hypothetical protein
MRKLVAPLLLAIGLLALLVGCSSPPLTGFTIELQKIEQAADGSLIATARLVNPNVVAYNVDSSTHALYLDGKLAGTLSASGAEGVPAQNSVVTTAKFSTAPGFVLKSGTASYRLESVLVMRLYGDSTEKQKLTSTGTVQIVTK